MSKGLIKLESPVFHFPKVDHENGLRDWYVPHASVDMPPGGPSLTRQDMAQECDINVIMERYEATGYFPSVVGREPIYADFTSVPNNMIDAMAQMHLATDAFMTLPASVRREFGNDPAQFVDFASDPDNLDQMRAWGLAPPAPKPAPVPVAEPLREPASSPASSGAPSPASAPAPSGAGHS